MPTGEQWDPIFTRDLYQYYIGNYHSSLLMHIQDYTWFTMSNVAITNTIAQEIKNMMTGINPAMYNKLAVELGKIKIPTITFPEDLINKVKEIAASLTADVAGYSLKTMTQGIWQSIENTTKFTSWVKEAWAQVWEWLSTKLVPGIKDAFSAGLEFLLEKAQQAVGLWDKFWAKAKLVFYDVISEAGPTILKFLKLLTLPLEAATSGIAFAIGGIWKVLSVSVQEFMAAIRPHTQKFFDPETGGVLSGIISSVMATAQTTMNEWDMIVLGVGRATPATAQSTASKLILRALGLGLAAHISAAGLEAFYPTKELQLTQIAGLFGEMASFRGIAQATTGELVESGLKVPYRYYVRNILRPMIPGENDLTKMYISRAISAGEYNSALGFQGYNEQWTTAYTESNWRWGGYFDMSAVIIDYNTNPEWLAWNLTRGGYHAENIPEMVKTLLHISSRGARTELLKAIMEAAEEGILSADQVAEETAILNIRPEATGYLTRAAELRAMKRRADNLAGFYRKGFIDNVLDEGDLKLALAALGMTPADVEAEVAATTILRNSRIAKEETAELKALKRKIQAVAVQVQIENFRTGRITGGLLESMLIVAGLEPEVAKLTTELETTKAETRTVATERATTKSLMREQKELARRRFTLAFRKGQIDPKQLLIALLQAGFKQQEAKEIAMIEVIAAAQPKKVEAQILPELPF